VKRKTKPPPRTVSTQTGQTDTAPPATQPTTTGAKPKRRTPVASGAAVQGDSFPAWAIAGFGIAALLIGAGISGLLVTRGRRR
jgi:hypothetical protein